MKTKSEQKLFTYTHPETKDVFTYDNETHIYTLNGIELPGTTTPLKLVNELTWDDKGQMSDKTSILQAWAIKMVTTEVIDKTKTKPSYSPAEIEEIVLEAKGAPQRSFKSAGVSGTEIHDHCEIVIKEAIMKSSGMIIPYTHPIPQVQNFINWAAKNHVKFLYSEEPLYSKDWMNCGTVDFVCEINGKTLVGDIKTNGNKRRYKWTGKGYDFTKPESDIHITALWQTACYGKMMTEANARKLLDKFDGVVVVNIKKSGEFDEKLDTRYNYNTKDLIEAYDHIINLYKLFRQQA